MTHPLLQAWLPRPDPRFQPGEVEISRLPGSLLFQARLTDTSITSASTANDQPLHLLGDTLEIFLLPENSTSYLELHISPHNHRSLLRWPLGAIEKVRQGIGQIEDYRLSGNDFQSTVTLTENGWVVTATVPLALVENCQSFRFSFSRYDYSEENSIPVHSSTSPHPTLNFHRTEDWLVFPQANP